MLVEIQRAGIFRKYPANFSQQRDVFRARDMMKNARGESNVKNPRLKRQVFTFEKHIIGRISETVFRYVEASWGHVDTDKITYREVATPKRDRTADSTPEVKNLEVLICAKRGARLIKYVFNFILGKIIGRFAGNANILGVKGVIFVCKPIKVGAVHGILARFMAF